MDSAGTDGMAAFRAWLAVGLLTAMAVAGFGRAAAQDAQAVDLELVLAVDSSGSIDADELRLQRGGWADAITHPRVLGAIGSGRHGAIAVMFLEWAAVGCETVAVDWMRISDAASAQRFANAVRDAPKLDCWGGNAIGDAVSFAARALHVNDIRGDRLVIDVSGDGPNTLGRPVELAREQAVASGITINGLAILTGRAFGGPGGMPLDEYYRLAVIGGPGAFVLAVDKDTTFRQAVLAKLVREIAGHRPGDGAGPDSARR
jgi:hypothetical protein